MNDGQIWPKVVCVVAGAFAIGSFAEAQLDFMRENPGLEWSHIISEPLRLTVTFLLVVIALLSYRLSDW